VPAARERPRERHEETEREEQAAPLVLFVVHVDTGGVDFP
jgi:hypothetical protein